ncbi:MAG: proline--tRNA ligase [Candidatus Roizmanbacteria bacterium]
MLYSKLFGKTSKTVSDESNISTKYLIQGGFIRESTAGRYFFLPLGWLVIQKMMKIIKEEIDALGAQEMISPTLHPIELWKETNRTNTAGFELMKVKDRRGAEFALGGTAEEMFVDVIRKFNISYRDLPIDIYQFSTKFRDEMRARGGLLRVREFIMKDAYSFDTDAQTFQATYKRYSDAYTRIFERLGLKTYRVAADNGYIGGEYCHEYVVESEAGESVFFTTDDGSYVAHEDVATFSRNAANAHEELKPFEIIDQPMWVQTMEQNEKHYKLSSNHFLKNVVYKHRVTGQIIIAVMTGDLKVNKTKLEQAIKAVGQLEDATDEDLTSMGTKTGYVHCWGHEIKVSSSNPPAGGQVPSSEDQAQSKKSVLYVGDIVLNEAHNLIGGQKEDLTDSHNVNYGRDFTCDVIADIAMAKDGDKTVDGKVLHLKKGIEVGNIFQLGQHYSSLMKGAEYVSEKGEKVPYYMGCYGIGVGRSLATIIEISHDDRGIRWPEAVAPYKFHLIGLDMQDETIRSKAQSVYAALQKKYGNEVLFDDRDARAGEKFADADLIGCPIRLVVGKKSGDKVEMKKRGEKESVLVDIENI